MKGFLLKLALLSACTVSVGALLFIESSRGLLSPRALAIALLVVFACFGGGWVFIARKAPKELTGTPESPLSPIDEATRKRRLLAIRAGKGMIALLVMSLIIGLFRGGPFLPVAVGVVMNLAITASVIWWVMRLERSAK